MKPIEFFVPGIPRPKGSLKTIIPKHGTRPVAIPDNPRTKPWQDLISLHAGMARRRSGVSLFSGPVALHMSFFFTPGGKLMPLWHSKKPDIDKLVRAVQDALTGILYKDDGQVCRLTANKNYAPREGVYVVVTDLEATFQEVPQYHNESRSENDV